RRLASASAPISIRERLRTLALTLAPALTASATLALAATSASIRSRFWVVSFFSSDSTFSRSAVYVSYHIITRLIVPAYGVRTRNDLGSITVAVKEALDIISGLVNLGKGSVDVGDSSTGHGSDDGGHGSDSSELHFYKLVGRV